MVSEVDTLFAGLGEEAQRAFLALGEPVTFTAGEILLPAGRSEWDTYVIQDGEVAIWVGNAQLAQLGPGQTLGSAAVLCPQLQWSAAWGQTDGTALRIPRESIMAFFEGRPQRDFQLFCVNLFRVWVDVLSQRNDRAVALQRRILNAATERRRERHRLLIVDDETEIRSVLEEFFETDYDVVTAADGLEAVDKGIRERPDLVLLDLRLPELDGFGVCQRLKTHPQTGHVPVVIVSAMDTIPDKVKGMMYGADEYLTKPVDLALLADTVKRILARVYGA